MRVVLLAGATGWIGGRLLPLLAREAYQVRCLEVWPEVLRGRVPDGVDVAHADPQDAASLRAALAGVETAFYLMHAQSASGETDAADRRAAELFGAAARAEGVARIVYFGGFGSAAPRAGTTPRPDVCQALRASGIPVLEVRASVILGSGSLCFEMLRALVERAPILLAPRWARAPLRPIHVDDALSCLRAAPDLPLDGHRTVHLEGPETTSFIGLMREYARLRGLRRWVLPLPLDLPQLSSLGVATVAPQYARIGRKVIDSLRRRGAVADAGSPMPLPAQPLGVRDALARAVRAEAAELTRTRWSRALSADDAVQRWGGARYRNRFVDSRVVTVGASPERTFAAAEAIGGDNGWYSAPWLWDIRGWMDRMVGGVGMGRGRRDPEHLVLGDVVDCWRVVALERGRRLLLAAEMKLPGHGWLEFEVRPGADGRTATLRQTASFDPLGLVGLLYWWLLWIPHQWVFSRMVRGLALQAEWHERARPPRGDGETTLPVERRPG